MKNNSIKSNYTIDALQWKRYPKGNIAEWDGLTGEFLKLVEKDKELLKAAIDEAGTMSLKIVFTYRIGGCSHETPF